MSIFKVPLVMFYLGSVSNVSPPYKEGKICKKKRKSTDKCCRSRWMFIISVLIDFLFLIFKVLMEAHIRSLTSFSWNRLLQLKPPSPFLITRFYFFSFSAPTRLLWRTCCIERKTHAAASIIFMFPAVEKKKKTSSFSVFSFLYRATFAIWISQTCYVCSRLCNTEAVSKRSSRAFT